MTATFPERIHLREVGPRDGLQNVRQFVQTEDKLAIVRSLAAAGLRDIEVTSIVSEKVIPQMADARAVVEGLAGEGITRSVLVPTPKRALEAVEAGSDQLIVFLSASEAHNQANVNRSIAESLAGLETIFRVAADGGVPVIGAVAVSLGCPYEGEVPPARVLDLSAAFLDLGAASLIFGDTTGMASPGRVERFVKSFQDRFAFDRYSLHFHNNRGTAMANLVAAMAAGATTFDTALGGIGGCPTVPQAAGNLSTEDVVCLLDEMGIKTGVDLDKLIEAARGLERTLGYALPGQVMKSGPVAWSGGNVAYEPDDSMPPAGPA